MQYDWYQATIDDASGTILDRVMGTLPGAHDVADLDHGRSGYRSMTVVRDRDHDVLATLLHRHPVASPNLTGTSFNAIAVARVVRDAWPVHRVSRVDVCEDMVGEGVFDGIEEQMRLIALRHNVMTGLSYIPDCLERGRTYRVGSKSSDVNVRLYEKGLEQLGKGVLGADPNHVRIEIQVRPQKAAKAVFATLEPEAVWGASKWSKDVSDEVLRMNVQRINTNPRIRSDLDAVLDHVAFQYGQEAARSGEVLAARLGLVDVTPGDRVRLWANEFADRVIRNMHAAHCGTIWTPPAPSPGSRVRPAAVAAVATPADHPVAGLEPVAPRA